MISKSKCKLNICRKVEYTAELHVAEQYELKWPGDETRPILHATMMQQIMAGHEYINALNKLTSTAIMTAQWLCQSMDEIENEAGSGAFA